MNISQCKELAASKNAQAAEGQIEVKVAGKETIYSAFKLVRENSHSYLYFLSDNGAEPWNGIYIGVSDSKFGRELDLGKNEAAVVHFIDDKGLVSNGGNLFIDIDSNGVYRGTLNAEYDLDESYNLSDAVFGLCIKKE